MIMKKLIISSLLLAVIVVIIFNVGYTITSRSSLTALSTNTATEEIDIKYRGLTIIAEALIANSKEDMDIKNNTLFLQQYIDKVSNEGGGIVKIPLGIYYFASSGVTRAGLSECVIKCKNNVLIEGSGVEETTGTILKPYAPSNNLPVDMFYYNNYAETDGLDCTFLKNADFKNFVIDFSLFNT